MLQAQSHPAELVARLTEQLFAALEGEQTADKPVLPSFKYKYEQFLPQKWELTTLEREEKAELGYDFCQVAWRSPDHLLTLRLEYRIYNDFPVVEWRPVLQASPGTSTGHVEQFRSLSLDLSLDAPQEVTVRRHLGCQGGPDDFQPLPVTLKPRPPLDSLILDNADSRSAAVWLPYFGVDVGERHGFSVGIGWPCAWSAECQLRGNTLHLDAGLRQSHFRLKANESIALPSIFLMLRDDMTQVQFQNLHRQFIGQRQATWQDKRQVSPHLSPHLRLFPPNASEEHVLNVIKGSQDKEGPHYDMYVLEGVSPQQYLSLASRLSEHEQTQLVPRLPVEIGEDELRGLHPKWFLPSKSHDAWSLDFGQQAVTQWTLGRFRAYGKCGGYSPILPDNALPALQQADEEDRQGITELCYASGLLELLQGLFAQGGQQTRILLDTLNARLDFTTIAVARLEVTRSSPATVETSNHLSDWIPQAGDCALLASDTDQEIRANLVHALWPGLAVCAPEFFPTAERQLAGTLVSVRGEAEKYVLLDTPEIFAVQYHLPDQKEGTVSILNRSPRRQTAILKLQGVTPRGNYSLSPLHSRTPQERKGSELRQLEVKLQPGPSIASLHYRRT